MATENTDTVTIADTLQVKNKIISSSFKDGFPDSFSRKDTLFVKPINMLPVMEVPSGKTSLSYWDTPLKSHGIMILLLLVFIVVSFSYKSGYKYFSNISKDLFSVRKRQNAFRDHTFNETWILSALIFTTCVLEGILLFFVISVYDYEVIAGKDVFIITLICILMCAVCYIFQLCSYYVLGNVFDDALGTRLWIEGYNASQVVLGIGLVPVTLILLFFPAVSSTMLFCVFVLYLVMHMVFICKGFRIFFNNLQSTLYFILYLCSIEIVPVILSYSGAIMLCRVLRL